MPSLAMRRTRSLSSPEVANRANMDRSTLISKSNYQDPVLINIASKESSDSKIKLPPKSSKMLPNARIEPRRFEFKYFIRRPRLLQDNDDNALEDTYGYELESTNTEQLEPSRRDGTGDEVVYENLGPGHPIGQSHDPETFKVQREWLNLFIDLLWVGIVSNVSSAFVDIAFQSDASWVDAYLDFCALFLASFRFWSYLRNFLGRFFNKDYLQSLFLTWILILALIFGIQTPYFRDPVGAKYCIVIFLMAKVSFMLIEGVYSIYIPSLRREFLINIVISIPVIALWVTSLVLPWPTRAILIISALSIEGILTTLISLPLGDWFLKGAPKKAADPENFLDRLQGFFIIVLGEGVFGLIAGNDWGAGLNPQTIYAIQALVIYYGIFWLFFTGDLTKTYVHAIYRNRYTSIAFELCHRLLLGAMLILDASIRYLVSNSINTDSAPAKRDTSAVSYNLNTAIWTSSASLSAALLFMTIKALLNCSLDAPGTLVVDNRFLRMTPRAAVMVVVMCLPISPNMDTSLFLLITLLMLLLLMFWEMLAGMEKGFKWFEPKNSQDTNAE